jgi:hypothetical protein
MKPLWIWPLGHGPTKNIVWINDFSFGRIMTKGLPDPENVPKIPNWK